MQKLGALFIAIIFGSLGVLYVVANPGRPAGALVRTTMSSSVGVVLDEIPLPMRARVAAAIAKKPARFWRERAAHQLRLATYRLVFRGAFYKTPKSSLPLPPEELWNIKIARRPTRRLVDGHDVVTVDYRFSSVLLTGVNSPGISEPMLARIGGTWDEPFVFPIDPELLLQRTDYACMDEAEFPFPSVDSEEVDSFYDHECEAEDDLGNVDQCHATKRVKQSCVDAVRDHVGAVKTLLTFHRLAWSAPLADQYRFGTGTGDGPDLQVYKPEFAASRVKYQYVHPSSCEVAEKAVGGTGWRRLLQFTTSDENAGDKALVIGHVDYAHGGKSQELDSHNLFEYSPCHNHFHFKYYGSFTWRGTGRAVNAKKGFCLQSTMRTANREGSPLHNVFAGCDYQGIEAGWVDQYKAGLPSQWLDTTGFPAGRGRRSFTSNPRGLLCEGTLVNASGAPLAGKQPVVWAKTGLVSETEEPVWAPRCKLRAGWDDNNTDAVEETIPALGLGLITTACDRGQIGPLRDCGFGAKPIVRACTPGAASSVDVSVAPGEQSQVVRVTEFSHVLSSPIPARYEDSYVPLSPGVADGPSMLANAIAAPGRTTVRFTCPSPRGNDEPGGRYSIYSAPVFPDDGPAEVTINGRDTSS